MVWPAVQSTCSPGRRGKRLATLRGARLAGRRGGADKELLTFGYRRFINDTYWLLMGFKSFDPGVTRELAGERKNDCGEVFDVVRFCGPTARTTDHGQRTTD